MTVSPIPTESPCATTPPHHVDEMLAIVRERLAIDFSQYRRTTVQRRIRNRMISVGARTTDEYLGLLRGSDHEAAALAGRITIKVSRFYRNRATFDVLRHEVLPALAAARHPNAVDVWVAGCGCGEEAYTWAMLLADVGCNGTVVATDIDQSALHQAAAGRFTADAVADVPADLAQRFLRRAPPAGADAVDVTAAVRARVRFHAHDLTSPAARWFGPPRLAIVSCRNVLIYLQKPAQERVLRTLARRLSPGGVLVLGEAEWLSHAVAPAFEALAPKHRIFRAVPARLETPDDHEPL